MDRKMAAIFITMFLTSVVLLTFYVLFYSKIETVKTIDYDDASYLETIFDKDKVIDVNISLSIEDFNEMMDNPTKEEYKQAEIIINGTKVENVGFRVKGNSSLNMVANSDSDRFSFKLDFNQYIDGQSLDGLTKLNLNNSASDPSYMREYLSYSLLNEMGVPTPAFCYANVYINGELIGLYLAVEGIEEPFLERYYGSNYGTLYKPEGQGSDLVYIDDKIDSYSGIRPVTDKKNGSDDQLLDMLKALNDGENLEKYLNIDEILRYFAVNTVLINMDSYQGNLKHNYYLYDDEGIFSILPWDYNMSFAGFSMGNNNQSSTSLYIDSPVSGTSVEERPLIGKLLKIEEYKDLYHQYILEFISGPFSDENMKSQIDKVAHMIRPYLEKDPTKFYTMEQFEQALLEGSLKDTQELNQQEFLDGDTFPAAIDVLQNQDDPNNRQMVRDNKNMLGGNVIGLEKFICDRTENVLKQLSGELPSVGETGVISDKEREIMAIRPEINSQNQNIQGLPPEGFSKDMNRVKTDRDIRQTDWTQYYYLLGSSILLIIILLIIILKKKTKYTI